MTIRYAYTDYPFESLGDKGGQRAPVRRCRVLAYDGNKYSLICVFGRIEEVKSGYLYMTPTRLESSRPFPRRWLNWLPHYCLAEEWIAVYKAMFAERRKR